MNRRLLTALGSSTLLVAAMLPAATLAADPLADNRLDSPVEAQDVAVLGKLDRSLVGGKGRTQVVVRLAAAPVGTVAGKSAANQKKQFGAVKAQQDAVVARIKGIDRRATLDASAQRALNAVVMTVDRTKVARIAADKRILSVKPVRDYQLDLSETVPYIGGTAVHDAGFTGEGVTVAVLDSGVDYTHAAFGGPGDINGYKNAYGVKAKDTKNRMITESYKGKKLFPTPKVIGGFDFVGEFWTGAAGGPPLAPDPDPIDCSPSFIGCGGGHGTHVADIIAGAQGVAPGAQLYAVKVCSSVTTACSGVALIQGMDFALDPNGDGSVNDRADLINMSLGSNYGQSGDDDLSQAVEVATAAGTLVVASAGNGGDKPFVTGTPAAAPGALSVAQTAVPSSTGFAISVKVGDAAAQPREGVFQSWSHVLDFTLTGVPVQFGNGTGGNLLGCDPFAAGSLAGKVVLVDRGVCNFSAKIANIALGGGAIGIIGLVTPEDPFDGTLGLCPEDACHAIPGYMVSTATANLMKNPAARVTFDPSAGVPLVGHMVGSSSRGPDNLNNLIKPEIGAPGASVSAQVGTGTGTTPFGGTSGAAPMVAGSAALLEEAFPDRSALEIKAVLINNAETQIMNRPAVFGGDIAPITRIGGGEVRVDRALNSPAAAWVDGTESAAVSFGLTDVTGSASIVRTIRVRNYSDDAITYAISSTFRFANDASNGAVSISAPASVNVPANGDATFDVTANISGSALRAWNLTSGSAGASTAALQTLEYDGYVWLNDQSTSGDDADPLHLPWQTLPRKTGDVAAGATSVPSGGSTSLTNSGVGNASVASFSLLATSPDDPDTGLGDQLADVDLRYVGFRTMDGAIFGCDSPIALAFGVNTWNRQVHSNGPALFEFDLDTNNDGTFDYAVFNFDLSNSGTLADGRNVVFAQNLATGAATAFFFTGHSTNSGNTTLTICGEQIGIDTAEEVGQPMGVLALAADWYNSGAVTDAAEDLVVVPGADRYTTAFSGSPLPLGTVIGAGAAQNVTVTDAGTEDTTESGVLLLLDWSQFGAGGAPADNEAIAIEVTAAP